MATNLYETLGIEADATPEQVRKAYKKKALATHPDRFAKATVSEKASAEEQFRAVNNAYEVLTDAEKRRVYDIHGVWPAPDEDEAYEPFSHHQSFSHHHHSSPSFQFHARPRQSRGWASHNHANLFSDPYTLFGAIFGNSGSPFDEGWHSQFDEDPFFSSSRMPGFPRARSNHSRTADLHNLRQYPRGGNAIQPMFNFPFGSMGMMGMAMPNFMGPMSNTRGAYSESQSHVFGRNGQWVEEHDVSVTSNGVTTRTLTQVDAAGNKHVTKTLHDGTTTLTINGVPQGIERDSGESFIPPAIEDMGVDIDGYPSPPLIAGSRGPPHVHGHSHSRRSYDRDKRYRTHEYDGPYGPDIVNPDREDWDHESNVYASERGREEPRRRRWFRR